MYTYSTYIVYGAYKFLISATGANGPTSCLLDEINVGYKLLSGTDSSRGGVIY